MKTKISKRNLLTIILTVICAALLACSVSLLTNLTSRNAFALKSSSDLDLGEITVTGYDSSNGTAVFSGEKLSMLYDALTGTSDGSATINKVAASLVGTMSSSYGYRATVNLPKYKTAADLYGLNGNKNIVLSLNGQQFAVSFLTTAQIGGQTHVIATLWMTQPLKDSSGTMVTGKFGWATAAYAVNYTTSIGASYISNAYSTSLLRMKLLNAGPTNATATTYAMGNSNANVTALSSSVTSAERLANVLAPFTLDNSVLTGANANKSLINYIATPSQLEYTYYLDWPYASGSNSGTSYLLNEALTSPMHLSTGVGKTTTTFYGAASNGTHAGYWWNAGVYNYATSTANHYNDWGSDYVWLPALSETGYSGADGLWATGKTTTGQIKFNNENTSDSATLAGTTVSTERVWLRTGAHNSPDYSDFLSSSGTLYGAFTAAALAVRPALHLDLTSAAQAAVSNASATDGYEIPMPQNISEEYNGATRWLADFAAILQTGTADQKYKWIDSVLHADTNIVTIKKIEYVSKDSYGTAATSSTDVTANGTGAISHAGVYTVTLELAAGYKWRGQPLVANDATSRQATFTITIEQAKLYYDLAFYDQSNNPQTTNKCEYAGATSPVEVKFITTAPASFPTGAVNPTSSSVTVYYRGTNAGNTFGAGDNGGKGSTTGPTDAGQYNATFEDSTTQSDYILTPNTSGGNTLSFTIDPKQVTLPTVTSAAQSYNGSPLAYNFSTTYNKNFVQVSAVRVKATEGGLQRNYTLTYNAATGVWSNLSGTGGSYEVTIDDSGSIAKVSATDAGEYQVEFDLVDNINTTWATGTATDKVASFTVNQATITVSFGAPNTSGNFAWSVGDTGNLSVGNIANVVSGENVTVDLYWYSSTDTTTQVPMYTTGYPDTTYYSISNFDSYGAGNYYLCAILSDDTSGDNVNRNYQITSTDPNTGDTGVETKLMIVTAGAATLNNIVWQYSTATSNPQNVVGNTITYDKVSGAAVAYTVSAAYYPSNFTATYSNATQSTAGTWTTTLTLEIPAADRANMEMPDPSQGYSYTGQGYNYTYVNSYRCTIDFDWTIEQKEIDLSSVSFEYSTNAVDANDTSATWQTYNPASPPEASGFDLFWVRVPATSIANTGITGVVAENYSNQTGPGVVDFDFNFTLDPNYKAQAGQVQSAMPYSMTTTGQQIQIVWVRTLLTDSNGNTVYDANNIPYYIYELDTTNIPSSAIPFIQYEYYEVSGNTYGAIISGGAVGTHNGMSYIIDPTGLNYWSQNSGQVYVHPVLVGMTQIHGVDPYVLVESAAQPAYKKITVGDSRRAVDVTAGTLTSMTYGTSVNITDAYTLTDRTLGQPMPTNSYKVALFDANGEVTPDVTGFDFSTLDAGNYSLVFTMQGTYDNTHIITNDTLPFVIEGIKLLAPTLKAGVTLTFSGVDQDLINSLDNFDPNYMEFASNSIDTAYHAGTYTAIVNIKSQFAGNYVFEMPATTSPTKSPARAALADSSVQLSNGNATAAIDWTIEKYVLDTTPKTAWNFASDGATLSYNGVPATIKALTMGTDPRLIINIAYYDTNGNPLTDVELKGGNKFLVAAQLDPSSLDANDIEFKNQTIDPYTGLNTSPQSTYTVPQSGAAAILGNLKDFVSKTWLGLPIWAWLLIALALLILLIIIIVVAAKRRKSKEEREEIKAKKEEEKQRKEEERQRREEEKQAQKERLEAERELAKAKQEAELEKIRMQAQMGAGMAGAGMATMAMQQPQPAQQQQQPQQPVQQQVQQPVVQQVQDNTLLAEIRAQMAEMRAENRATQAQVQAMQNMQNQQPHYAPQYAPQYAPAPAPAVAPAASADGNLMTLMEMKLQMSEMKNQQAVAEMKSAQAVAEVKAAQALAEAKAANHQSESHSQQSQQPIIVMAPTSPMGMNQNAPYSPTYPNYGGYPSVNMGYGLQALPAPQQVMPTYGVPPYGMVPPYGVPPYGYPVAMLPQPQYAPQKAAKEEEPVVTSSSQTNPSMTVSQPPYAYPPGAVMTTTTTIDTSRAEKSVKRTAADSADDVNFDVDGFYDPFN